MPVLFGSRYILANAVEITTEDTLPGFVTILDRFHFSVDDLRDFSYRSTRQNNDLDLLAFNITGREGLWFLIADVNEILDPFETIETGRQLVIPTSESFSDVIALLERNA